MELFVQPDDTSTPLIKAIHKAEKCIDIMIFRFDCKDVEEALVKAIKRGIAVQALIAFTNRGGEKRLRDLEARLLAAGAVVARTSDDLPRYHGKYFIVDQRKLYLLSFNFTKSDIERSRSFGVATTDSKLVQEALRLFHADRTRQPYTTGSSGFLVSPVNARERLLRYLKGAKDELLIYDLDISDKAMLRALKERAGNGVEVRVIGYLKTPIDGVEARRSHPLRLHTRVIVRDRDHVFVGSQSLCQLELDFRREVGIISRDRGTAAKIAKVFERDWETAKSTQIPVEKVAGKVAKVVAKTLTPVAPVLEEVAAKNGSSIEVDPGGLQQVVKEAVKAAVRDAVHETVIQESAKRP